MHTLTPSHPHTLTHVHLSPEYLSLLTALLTALLSTPIPLVVTMATEILPLSHRPPHTITPSPLHLWFVSRRQWLRYNPAQTSLELFLQRTKLPLSVSRRFGYAGTYPEDLLSSSLLLPFSSSLPPSLSSSPPPPLSFLPSLSPPPLSSQVEYESAATPTVFSGSGLNVAYFCGVGEGPLKEQLVGQLADTHYQHFAFILVNRSVEDNTHINPLNVVKGTVCT